MRKVPRKAKPRAGQIAMAMTVKVSEGLKTPEGGSPVVNVSWFANFATIGGAAPAGSAIPCGTATIGSASP